MLIDDVLPRYDAVERHAVSVRAPAERTYAALRTADLASSTVVRLLLVARALPARLAGAIGVQPRAFAARRPPFTLDQVLRRGFVLVAEDPGRELVLGVTGRFWRPTGALLPTDAARFRDPPPAGAARAAWNFTVTPTPRGTRLATETRVHCGDKASRVRFRLYWLVVRPFSGLIRRLMLRSIRREAEWRAPAP